MANVVEQAPAVPSIRVSKTSKLKSIFAQSYLLVVLLAICLIGVAVAPEYFQTGRNLANVVSVAAIYVLLALGQFFVILTGGIDLSVGSAMGLSSLITALCFAANLPMPVAIAAGLFVGLLFGLTNGVLITVIGLPPFIATLGTLSIGRGMMYMITHGVPVTPDTPDSFAVLGQGYIGLVPVPVVIMLVLMVAFAIIMRRTRFGRYIYATGGNENAARLSGVKVNAIKLSVYMISSTIAALAGSTEPASLSPPRNATRYGAC